MKIRCRSWKIVSDEIKEIKMHGIWHQPVDILSLELVEERDEHGRLDYGGTIEVKKEDESRLDSISDKVATYFTINLDFHQGEAPFRELNHCRLLPESSSGGGWRFMCSDVNVLNNGADIKIEKRTWEIASNDLRDREIQIKDNRKSATAFLSSLIVTEEGGERYSCTFDFFPGADPRFKDIGEKFNIVLKSHSGDASPFKELLECTKEEGKAGYKVTKVEWA